MQKSSRTLPTRDADSGHDLVICYGNPLRGDDGIAWQVAQELLDLKLEHLEVITVHQLMPELAQMVAQASGVIFVDASLEIEPGEIMVRELEPAAQSKTFTHHLEPGNLLALANMLYGRAPQRAIVVSVGVSDMDYTEQLSPTIQTAIPKILEVICLEINSNNKPRGSL
jgi:hydrogenase maturation protease